jgi:hypothetical protein
MSQDNGGDPGRKLSPADDAEIARLRSQGVPVPYRAIAKQYGVSVGAVQKAEARAQKRQAELDDEIDELDELAGITGVNLDPSPDEYRAELEAELAADPGNELARYRLRHVPPPGYGYPTSDDAAERAERWRPSGSDPDGVSYGAGVRRLARLGCRGSARCRRRVRVTKIRG